jgi:hypothetical protein
MWQWLFGWWDSLESVTNFSRRLSFGAFIFAFLAALCAGLQWLSDKQRDYLTKRLEDPWQLSTEQREQFVAILRQAPSKIGLKSAGDAYTVRFGVELDKLFTDAGWETHGTLGGETSILHGIRITIHLPSASDEEPPERFVLKNAFGAVDIPVKIDIDRTNPHLAGKFTWLHVGERPQS